MARLVCGKMQRNRRFILILVAAVSAAIVLGFVVGYFVRKAVSPSCRAEGASESHQNSKAASEAVDDISAPYIKEELR